MLTSLVTVLALAGVPRTADAVEAAPQLQASLAVKLPAKLGEGSIWDPRSKRLLWVDLVNAKLYRYDPQTGENEEHDLAKHSSAVTSVVPLSADEGGSGNKVGVTLAEGFAIYDFSSRQLEVLPGNPPLVENERFNDGKADPAGRYWAGTMTLDASYRPIPKGALYRRNADGHVDKVVDPVSVSNGIVWTSDASTMYYIDTDLRRVDAFDYDVATGAVSNRRTCITDFDQAARGVPDGSTLDRDGKLWVARHGGGCAGRYDPETGRLLAEVCVPANAGRLVTSVAFGGDDLGDLYLTTAKGWDAATMALEFAGSLYRVMAQDLASVGAVPGAPTNALRMAALVPLFP